MRRAILLALALAVAGCGGADSQQAAAPEGGVRNLANVLELRSDFEAEAGKTRLVVLFSPT